MLLPHNKSCLLFVALFIFLLTTNSYCQDEVRLSNGISYKLKSENGKPANYFIQEIKSLSAETDSVKRYIIKFKSDPELRAKSKRQNPTVDRDHENFSLDIKKIEGKYQTMSRGVHQSVRINGSFKKAFNGKAVLAPKNIIDEIAKLPYVHSVIEDKKVQSTDLKSNGIIKADKVWSELSSTGAGVVIAIIDTGIDYNHADIGNGIGEGKKVIGGYDFVNDDNDPMDDNGHGTHVAGIAAANGTILKGVAPDAQLIAYKVLSKDGSGYDSWIIAAIERCLDPDQNPNTDDKVDVVNMSLGRLANGADPLSEVVNNAVQQGIVFVVAAGNNGETGYETISTPGIAQYAITVGATDSIDALTYFSSKGPEITNYSLKPDLVAPGFQIFSSLPNEKYDSWSGTSMASPHVAGAAALLLQLHPDWTPEVVKAVLMQGAKELNANHFEVGTGRLDILKSSKASFAAYPASISFGIVDKSLPVISKKFQLTLSNFSNQQKTFNLSNGGDLIDPAINMIINPSTIAINGGMSQIVNVTIDIQTSGLIIKNLPDFYAGFINITDESLVSIKIPVGFLNPEVVKLHFEEPIPYSVDFTGIDNQFQKRIFPLEKDIIQILPSGQYNAVAYYTYDHFEIKENIDVPASNSLSFNKVNVTNALVYQPVDENGQRIDLYNSSGTAALTTSQGAGYTNVYIGDIPDTLFVSTVSSNWKVGWVIMNISSTRNKIYTMGSSEVGVSGSKLITNSPSDFVPIKYQYDQIPNTNTGLIRYVKTSLGMFFDNPAKIISSDFVEYRQKMDKESFIVSTQYDIYGNESSGFNFRTPDISFDENDSIVFRKIMGARPTGKIKISGSPVEITLGETMLQWSATMANSKDKVIVEPWTLDGFFNNNRGDKVLGKINYSLFNNSGLTKTGSILNPSLINSIVVNDKDFVVINNPQPQEFLLKLEFEDYQVEGKYGKASTELRFNTSLDDRNPPYLNRFEMYNKDGLTNKLKPGETAILAIEVSDYCYSYKFPCTDSNSGVFSYSVQYKKLDDLSWSNLILEKNTAQIPTNLSEGFYSLFVKAIDSTGNSMEYKVEPAFLIGSNPNPVPFQKPILIYPENYSQVPQNSIFRWSSLENILQYQFELSTDSIFSTSVKNVLIDTNSLTLDISLASATRYYWRVKAKYTNNNFSPWSEISSFTIGNMKLLLPPNNSTGPAGLTTFKWTKDIDAIGYQFRIYYEDGKIGFTQELTDTTYTYNFLPDRSFQWQIRPRYKNIIGDWTQPFRFSTYPPTPTDAIITLMTPANGTSLSFINPDFSWTARDNIAQFDFQISQSNDFSSFIFEPETNLKSITLSDLIPSTTYFWRVEGLYNGSVPIESEIFSFTTYPVTIDLLFPSDKSIDQNLDVQFQWKALPFVSGYQFMISPHQDFLNATTTNLADSSISVKDLSPYTKYYWKVGAQFLGTEYWSTPYSFQTILVLGVDETKIDGPYPNPATSVVFFDFETTSHTLKILNSLGQIVWSHTGSERKLAWEINSENPYLEGGVYYAIIQDGDKTINKKIAVLR